MTAAAAAPAPSTPALPSLPDGYRAVVVGASGGIGAAFVARFASDPRCAGVEALSRRSVVSIDFDRPSSIADAAAALASPGPVHVLINAVGLLHSARVRPDKRLADLEADALAESFRVNAIGPALLLRHFVPLLARDRVLVASLSAKVGSIGDNRLGGWVGYRASKAALNMVVRTAAIEVARTRPRAVVVVLHPGTVATGLSRPFADDDRARPPDVAVGAMLETLDRLVPADSGGFFAYDGVRLPW